MRRLSLLPLCLSLLLTPLAAQDLTSPADRTRFAAALIGVPADALTDVTVQDVHFRTLDVTVRVVKAVDEKTGEVLSDVRDHTGRPVDLSTLRAREIAARRATPIAKLTDDLKEAMTQSEYQALPIILWLDYDAAALDAIVNGTLEPYASADLSTEEAQALEASTTPVVMARIAEITLPMERFLDEAGYGVRYRSTSAPVLLTDATPEQILALAALPEIDTIYLQRDDNMAYNDSANATHRTDRVKQLGLKGAGVRVAVHEGGGIDPACPWLNISGWFNPGSPAPNDHVHGTTGCIASQKPDRLGAAPAVTIFSANSASYLDPDLLAAADWVATQNIDVTNGSWGPITPPGTLRFWDRYFDYQARTYADTFCFSAGNSGLSAFVGNVGWNMTTVGGISDGGDGNWDNDAMYTSSSSQNPNTGCEKPNVVGLAVDVDTLGMAPDWIRDGYNGTSFSSPHCAGNLADAMDIDGTLFTNEPALAAVMACAWHNIEGSSRLSDQDGAGGINGLALVRMGLASRVSSLTLAPTSFVNNGYYTKDIWLQGGDKTRVCIAWSSNANSGYTTDVLDADLDLAIYAGQGQTSGTYFGGSSSFNNNFEIVEFSPPTTGWYTVRINDYTFNGTSERCGIAWSQRTTDTMDAARIREFTSESTSTAGPTIGQPTYWMDFDAPNSPNAAYICVPGGLNGDGLAFGGGTWSPLNLDIWTILWLDHLSTNAWFWTNPIGLLDSSGTSGGNRMMLPDYPGLVGTTLSHIGFTIAPGYPDNIKEITGIHTFTFWPTPTEQPTSDDGSVELPLPFPFPFYGNYYNSVWVNMNGNVTFGAGDSDFTESEADMLAGAPRIAALWDDLGPHQGGLVRTRVVPVGEKQAVIEYVNVPQLSAADANTARIILHADGRIVLQYRDVDLWDCIAGISPGNGLSTAPSKDLTSSGFTSFGGAASYQVFTSYDTFDLNWAYAVYYNDVRFFPTNGAATSYRMEVDIKP